MDRWLKLLGCVGVVKPHHKDDYKGLVAKPEYRSEALPTMGAIIHREQESIVKAQHAKNAKNDKVSKAEIIPFLD